MGNSATATAPYNFVLLPSKPLASEIYSVENFKAHIESRGKISVEIKLERETLTPIILGSILHGMFENIFKIVTCRTFRGRTAS